MYNLYRKITVYLFVYSFEWIQHVAVYLVIFALDPIGSINPCPAE